MIKHSISLFLLGVEVLEDILVGVYDFLVIKCLNLLYIQIQIFWKFEVKQVVFSIEHNCYVQVKKFEKDSEMYTCRKIGEEVVDIEVH